MLRVGLLILLLITANFLTAQNQFNGNISLRVLNDRKIPLENTSASLIISKDSSLYKTGISDKNGLVEFSYVKPGNYLVKISAANFEEKYSLLIPVDETNSNISLPDMVMEVNKASQLKAVTVTAKKPFIQKLGDRLVVNVENSIVSAGSSAMDVLERSPGVNIDQNDAISLRGRQGVIIMIDGKPSPMTGADLANYLRGLPSAAIDRIDIITNPSAKYDAAGNSGIIDIHLK